MKTGDIILVDINTQGWVSWFIKLGAAIAGYPKPARRFSHAALVISDHGDIAEAVERGVRRAHVSKYQQEHDYKHLRMSVDAHDAAEIVAFADSVLEAKWRYGFATFAACGLNCLLAPLKWAPFSFSVSHTAVCSGLVADALTRAGVIWDRPVPVVMPADIWQQFGHRADAS